MTHTPTPTPQREQSIRAPVLWGLAFGAIQAASPLALRWLDQATVQALLLAFIAAVYIGFAVADGRPKVIAVESAVAGASGLLAAAGVTGSAWLLVLGYAGHGLKDFWQERLLLPKTSSMLVGADARVGPMLCAVAAGRGARARGGCCGMVIDRAAASGLYRCDERVRAAGSAAGEQPGQRRGDPGAALPALGPAAAARSGHGAVHRG
jgi:hypothetical protein